MKNFVKDLSINPDQGIHLGNNVHKIRLAISSKGKGKSGGARIITYLRIEATRILLVSIYDKGDKESITNKEIKAILRKYI